MAMLVILLNEDEATLTLLKRTEKKKHERQQVFPKIPENSSIIHQKLLVSIHFEKLLWTLQHLADRPITSSLSQSVSESFIGLSPSVEAQPITRGNTQVF